MVDRHELGDLDPYGLLDEEYERLERFFARLAEADWAAPTRCEGWGRREVLCHMAGAEVYHRAGLDDDLAGLKKRAAHAGVRGFDGFNEWQVGQRSGRSGEEVLAEWRDSGADVRRRLRQRGREGTLATMVGPYPSGLQAFHLAIHAATHADDMDVAIDPEERRWQIAWRARFSRFALAEAGSPVGVELEKASGLNRVRLGDEEALLSDEELVEAAAGRLPDSHPLTPGLREALKVLA